MLLRSKFLVNGSQVDASGTNGFEFDKSLLGGLAVRGDKILQLKIFNFSNRW